MQLQRNTWGTSLLSSRFSTDVKPLVSHWLRNGMMLHVLFNNGDVMFPPVEQITTNGYIRSLDLPFQANTSFSVLRRLPMLCLISFIGYFYFTHSLMPTRSGSLDHKSQVTNTPFVELSKKNPWCVFQFQCVPCQRCKIMIVICGALLHLASMGTLARV